MAAISTRLPQVAVEFDAPAGRATKHFADAFAARRFYARQMKLNHHPKVTKGEHMPTATKAAPKKKAAKKAAPKKKAAPAPKPAKPKAAPAKPEKAATPKPSKRTKPTIIALMQAALTDEPQTMAQLLAAAGTTAPQYGQMGRLIAAGKAIRTPDGKFRLP